MILFKDFVPEVTKRGLFKKTEYEGIELPMERFNDWVSMNPQYDIINIETVLLPNIHNTWEEGSEDTSLRASGEMPTTWHQIIRVWYLELKR